LAASAAGGPKCFQLTNSASRFRQLPIPALNSRHFIEMMVLADNRHSVFSDHCRNPAIICRNWSSCQLQFPTNIRIVRQSGQSRCQYLGLGQEGIHPVSQLIAFPGLADPVAVFTQTDQRDPEARSGLDAPDQVCILFRQCGQGVGVQDHCHISSSISRKSSFAKAVLRSCTADLETLGSDSIHSLMVAGSQRGHVLTETGSLMRPQSLSPFPPSRKQRRRDSFPQKGGKGGSFGVQFRGFA